MSYKVEFKFGDEKEGQVTLRLPHSYPTVEEAKEVARAVGIVIADHFTDPMTDEVHLNASIAKVGPSISIFLQSPVKEQELTPEGFVEGEDEPSLQFTTPEDTFNAETHPLEIKRYVDGLRQLYPNIEVEG